MSINLKNKRGFTLVELMIVVAIIGVLAALAIYGVKKYLTSSKTAEARAALGRMSKDAASHFNGETMTGEVLVAGAAATPSSKLCLSAPNKVPSEISGIQGGKKYQSKHGVTDEDWDKGDQNVGWVCLKFSLDAPQYYMYSYTQTGSVSVDGTFLAKAESDFDGDGTVFGTLSMSGQIEKGAVKLSPGILEQTLDE